MEKTEQDKCPNCYNPSDGKLCETCLEERRDTSRERIAKRRENKQCVKCKNPSENYFCPGCKKIRRELKVALYNKRKNSGVCVYCRKLPALPERVSCLKCKVERAKYKKGIP